MDKNTIWQMTEDEVASLIELAMNAIPTERLAAILDDRLTDSQKEALTDYWSE